MTIHLYTCPDVTEYIPCLECRGSWYGSVLPLLKNVESYILIIISGPEYKSFYLSVHRLFLSPRIKSLELEIDGHSRDFWAKKAVTHHNHSSYGPREQQTILSWGPTTTVRSQDQPHLLGRRK